MTNEEFAAILEARIESIRKIISSKAKEYAIGDKLYNFKRAAEISRTTPAKALLGMLMKHVVSVIDLVEGSVPATPAMVDEKLGDAINYLILLEAVFKEGVVEEKADRYYFKISDGIENLNYRKTCKKNASCKIIPCNAPHNLCFDLAE